MFVQWPVTEAASIALLQGHRPCTALADAVLESTLNMTGEDPAEGPHLAAIAVRAPAEVLVVAIGIRADPVSFPALSHRAASTTAAAAIATCTLC